MYRRVPLIAVFGRRKSGKTRLIEAIVSAFSKMGFKIATLKHVHHGDFEVDVEGKDTWRHMKAGASIVVGVSTGKIAIIERSHDPLKLNEIFEYLIKREVNLIILEGFQSIVGKNPEVYKIVMARDLRELNEIVQEISPPIIAISGRVSKELKEFKGIPVKSTDEVKDLIKLIKSSTDL